MRKAIVFEAPRSGYGIDQIADGAMTVGELKEILEGLDDNTLFVLSHDNGYTYGSIKEYYSSMSYEGEDGEFSETDFDQW